MEQLLATALLVFGIAIVLASADDVIIDLLLRFRIKRALPAFQPAPIDDLEYPEIAIFVANWHEANVLGPMVERNLANFTYKKVKFILGVYPNDTDTLAVAKQLSVRFPNSVQVIVNTRNGPTSKGQMLNEMFAQLYAAPDNAPDLVIMHDSEDVIAPKSFEVFADAARRHAMIQIPIYSLDSRHRSFVAATYMEEFAERHTQELRLREQLGAFVPSAGVGTGLRKDLILHFLNERGHVLQPGSVTEDYILGAEAHQAGFSTTFAAYRDGTGKDAQIIATRELFPKEFWASVRQRTRWTFGIGFEGPKRLGWFGSGWNRFFLYRDRKGSVTNFLSLISLALLLICLIVPPDFSQFAPWQRTMLLAMLGYNTLLIVWRIYAKARSLKDVYGCYDVLGLIVRWPVAVAVNAVAAGRAWRNYLIDSGRATKPIAWAKTTHEIPAEFGVIRPMPAAAHGWSFANIWPSPNWRMAGVAAAVAGLSFLAVNNSRISEVLTTKVEPDAVAIPIDRKQRSASLKSTFDDLNVDTPPSGDRPITVALSRPLITHHLMPLPKGPSAPTMERDGRPVVGKILSHRSRTEIVKQAASAISTAALKQNSILVRAGHVVGNPSQPDDRGVRSEPRRSRSLERNATFEEPQHQLHAKRHARARVLKNDFRHDVFD